jgi:uncharacterized protein with GYD domain
LIGGYYTFGEYDMVIIIEAPNDETVMSLLLKVGPAGGTAVTTVFVPHEYNLGFFPNNSISITTNNLA